MRNKIISATILLFALLAAAAMAAADAPELRVAVDRRNILIGDRIRYDVEVRYRKGIDLAYPAFENNLMGDFEIKDSGARYTKGLFGSRLTRRWYLITSYSAGKRLIPPYEIRYRESGAKEWATLKSGLLYISVKSILAKVPTKGDIKDIKGPLYFSNINWPMILLVFFVPGILLAVIFIYRKRRMAGPVKLPHETALEELEALAAFFARGGDLKEFHVGVSDCVRRYIERAFRLRAPEMTTEEFLYSSRESAALSAEQKGLLKDFLNACDLVKFAKYAPARNETEAVFTAAKKFVEETKEAALKKIEDGTRVYL